MNSFVKWIFNRPRSLQGDAVAALDVGSSKIACFIARLDDKGLPQIIGIGHQLAEGMRCGVVADMEALRRSIAAAVASAEQMANEVIERVIVNVSGPLLQSRTVGVEMQIGGREITVSDIDRMVARGQTMVPEDLQGNAQELIHTIPVNHIIDGQKGIRDPLGMTGNLLQTKLHLVSAAFGPTRTLAATIARCHLEVERLVAAPYASGLACLVEDEMDLGCIVIDIGAGTTSIGIFFDGCFVYADGLSIGGAHITSDIAGGLTTSLANAERLKTLYGSAITSSLDERELLDVPLLGEDSSEYANHVPKSQLLRIIQPRIEEIFELVKQRLDNSGLDNVTGRRVVLTGGTSQLPGIRDVAQRILDKQVRLGRPLRISKPSKEIRGSLTQGLAEATSGPAFSTTAGLLAVAIQPELAGSGAVQETSGKSMLSRVSQWVKHNF